MKISIEEEERAKHKKDNTLKPWCPRPARKKRTLVMSSALGHKRREAACYFSHVRRRGYKALTRECRQGEYAELGWLRTNTQFNSTA